MDAFKLIVAAIILKAADLSHWVLSSSARAARRASRRLAVWMKERAWPVISALSLALGRTLRALAVLVFRLSKRASLWIAPRVATAVVAIALVVGRLIWALVRGVAFGMWRTLVVVGSEVAWVITNIPTGLRKTADVRIGDVVTSPYALGRGIASAAKGAGENLAYWQPEKFQSESRRLRARGVFTLTMLVAANAVFYAGFSVVDATAGQSKSEARVLGVKLATLPERSHILARDGTEMAVLFKDENRQVVDLSQIAPVMVRTTVAVEDRRFYQHHGFDLRGTLRAVVRNLLEGKALEGGSTITQQYVRSRYLENARTIPRKFREIMLAIQLEQRYTKDAILEAYLNSAYFGEGNYGVEAASESYFGVHASELRPEQAALLVSVLRSPSNGSPFLEPQDVLLRRNLVIDQMAEAKVIDSVQRDELIQKPLEVRDSETSDIKMAPHFVELVKRRLLQDHRLGSTYQQRYRAVFSGGLTVITTLDSRIQLAAENAVAKLPKGIPEGAAVVMDPEDGDLLAYRGGRDFDARKFDLVSQGRRQPGSAFKTFGLVAALSSNFSPNLSLGGNSPCEFELPTPDPWKVENFGGDSYGTVSLKEATKKSINCAYADLVMNHIDPGEVVAAAQSMGISSPLDPYPSIALGGLTTGVTPLEMTRAFATLASEGWRPKVRPILEVRDRNGDVIIRDAPDSEQVLPENVARMTTSLLKEVVESGTATDAQEVGRPAAGKTGTTQANRDAWFIGYTPDFVGTVWLGHPDAQIEMRGVTGGSVAAGIWAKIMNEAHLGIEPHEFITPDSREFIREEPSEEVTPTPEPSQIERFDWPKPRGRDGD